MRRSYFLAGLLATLALGAAACSEGDDDVTREQRAAIEGLNAVIQNLESGSHSTIAQLESLDGRVSASEVEIDQFARTASVHALDRSADVPDPPAGMVALRLSFGTFGEPLAGDGIKTYEPDPEVNTLWAMESLPAGVELPVGEEIPDSTIFLAPGEQKFVTVAYENPTASAVRFMAVPHQESPGSMTQFVQPTCLCFSFVYEAPANGAWYRVIRIGADPKTPPGSKADMLWSLLTDPEVFPES